MPHFIIDNKTKILYLELLIKKIFKILPLFEECPDNIFVYLGGLIIDICSANNLFDGILIETIVKLNSLKINKLSHKEVRKIVLETTNIVDKIRKDLINNG